MDSTLRAAVERARSEHGRQAGPDLGNGALTLTKGNWTALTALPSPDPEQKTEFLVIMSLTCLDGGSPTATPAQPGLPGR
ncbi:hypothetical protein [Streptomyces erythrochromogenes]|uniref:hypothetical protein n=1 Tax=Streptomyces erythrochromogenes TaxID=285574 RepID=UPI0037D7938F